MASPKGPDMTDARPVIAHVHCIAKTYRDLMVAGPCAAPVVSRLTEAPVNLLQRWCLSLRAASVISILQKLLKSLRGTGI